MSLDLRRLVPALGITLLAALTVFARPPQDAGERAWRQLRLRADKGSTGPGADLVITRTTHVILPPVHRRPTTKLFRGDHRVVDPGAPGLTATVRQVHIGHDGIARPLAAEHQHIRSPRAAVWDVGTAAPRYLVREGVTYRYMRKVQLVATAYNASRAQNGPWGAVTKLNGMPLVQGMVAVDPSVIPLGTRLYVEGYGPALAADTGSAIIGDRIDLFYDLNAKDTANFGIRKVNVYILGPQT